MSGCLNGKSKLCVNVMVVFETPKWYTEGRNFVGKSGQGSHFFCTLNTRSNSGECVTFEFWELDRNEERLSYSGNSACI